MKVSLWVVSLLFLSHAWAGVVPDASMVVPHVATSIPRACSTPSTSKYPFCDTTLSNDARIKDLISRLSLDEKAKMLTARESPKGDVPRIGLPEFDWGTNCLHGVQSRCGTRCPTSFPSPNALGAAWDGDSIRRMASIIGWELRALWLEGVGENHDNNLPHVAPTCWSPNININRDPRWGRNQEVSSEDPFLTAVYGIQHTLGLQKGEGKDPRYLQTAVTLKHYAAYSLENIPGTNITRENFNAIVNDHDMADTYLVAWKAAVKDANAKGVMCSYNAINGVPTCASSKLRDYLRKDWGFEGYVTSDTGAIEDIWEQHKYVKTAEEALLVALRDGETDICSGDILKDNLSSAVEKGIVTESMVDRAMYNSLRIRFELGLLDPIDKQPYWHVDPTEVNTKESQDFNLELTKKSLVLLKNDAGLPWAADSKEKIAVLGPHADAQEVLVGNYLGQICPGHYQDFSCITKLSSGIESVAGASRVSVNQGCDVDSQDTSKFADAIKLAEQSDKVVLAIGLDQKVEGEANDRQSIRLPGVQEKFVSAVLQLNKPTTIVIINGGVVSLDFLEKSNGIYSIIEAWYPGYQGASAIASTLFGQNEFLGGKLPVTMYREEISKDLDFTSMDWTLSPGRSYRYYTGDVVYPFGYGLSFTTWSLSASSSDISGLTFSNKGDLSDEKVVSVRVANTGAVTGDEVVQAYFKPMFQTVDDTKHVGLQKQLFWFQRVHAGAGDHVDVKVPISVRNFQTVARTSKGGINEGDIVSLAGAYQVIITNGNDETITVPVTVTGESVRVMEPFPQHK